MSEAGELIQRRLQRFVRDARGNGFEPTLSDALAVQELALAADPFEPMAFYWQARSLLCRNRSEWGRFEGWFLAWFYPQRGDHPSPDGDEEGYSPLGGGRGAGMRYMSELQGMPQTPGADDVATGGGSAQETLSMADFRFVFDRAEQRRLELWLEQLVRRVRRRVLRRRERAYSGAKLNWRRTWRAALASGGEPLRLHRQRRQRRLPRLLIILDVSQSMDVYTRFFLRFAMGVSRLFSAVEVFAFHTRLVPLGDVLRESRLHELEARLTGLSKGWLGGTRIADSLEQFNREHLSRCTDGRTTVLVFSDGYDTAAPGALETELGRIARRVGKVLWLHPLLARPGGPKIDPGLQQALCHIDALLPAHSLKALEALEKHL